MKKIIIFFTTLLAMLPVFADTMPFYRDAIPKRAIGVYQASDSVTLYNSPDKDKQIIKKIDFSYNPETMPDGVFALLLNDRKLGLLYVSDIGDDNWIQVVYDKKTGAKGWVETEDKFQFLPWINFYNMYGRKYGLRLLKDAPEEAKILHAKSDEASQGLGKLNHVKKIKLTAIRGNWALVSVYDLDRTLKVGYIRWRGDDGTIYAFPDIK